MLSHTAFVDMNGHLLVRGRCGDHFHACITATFLISPCVLVSFCRDVDRMVCEVALRRSVAVDPRLPWHANIVQALAMDDRNAAQMSILYELGESDFEDYAWGRASASTTETAR